MLQKAQNDFMGHAANVLPTGRYGQLAVGGDARLLLELRAARLTKGDRHDVIQLHIWGKTWVTVPVVICADPL